MCLHEHVDYQVYHTHYVCIYAYAFRYNTDHNSETAKLLIARLQQDPDIKDEIKWIISSKTFKLFADVYPCSASILNIHHDDMTSLLFIWLYMYLYRSSALLL